MYISLIRMILNKIVNMALQIDQKSIAQGLETETILESGFSVLTFSNVLDVNRQIVREVDSSIIQFHFCLKGQSIFTFNNGAYHLPMPEDQSLLLYNPQRDLPMNLQLQPDTWVVSILMSIKKFHSLFSREANYITFLSEENKDRKYYKDGYFKGKAYELLSLYFNKPVDADIAQCPFLADEDNVTKIKKAKEIIIARMTEPPTLLELSIEIGLSLKKLKEGFKQIYGDSVYSFLFDYIKKKFGTTPKKYLMSLG